MKTKQLKEIAKQGEETKKLTLGTILNSTTSLGELMVLKLPVMTSFKISMFIKAIQPAIEAYEEARKKLLTELGTKAKDKDGKELDQFIFKGKNQELFAKAIEELTKAEIDVKVPDIKVEDLGKVELSPSTLLNVSYLFKDLE